MPEEVFIKALQEAVHLAILEERSQVGVIRYRFTHAFFRQTLYEEMIAPRRLQLHQQVARALEDPICQPPGRACRRAGGALLPVYRCGGSEESC